MKQTTPGELRVGLSASFRDEYPRTEQKTSVATTKQHFMAFGFFPGAAEEYRLPEDAEPLHCMEPDYPTAFLLGALPAGVFVVLGTAEALVWELPFGSYECHKKNDSATHLGLFGFHKYTATKRAPPVTGPRTPIPSEWRPRANVVVPGPYEVELSIPALRHTVCKTVERRHATTVFELPTVRRDCTVDAFVSFRKSAQEDAAGEEVAKVLEFAKGKRWKYTLDLEAPLLAETSPGSVSSPQVREVVREIHHYHETRVEVESAARGFDVEKAADDETGRTIWRVEILAENLNAFAVDREVKPQILQELRDDFAGRNPNVPRGEINAFASYTTEDGGRTLVYVGVAESLIPSLESLTYSAETHRGTVTMRLSGGADLRRSKEFVRDNISAIVCDKNVVLTAGERPPDGGQYRSLDENFADGVLAVEFEAVE